MSKVGSYGYERQRTNLELKENVCVAPISVPTTLYSGVDTLPEIWRGCLKKGTFTLVPGEYFLRAPRVDALLEYESISSSDLSSYSSMLSVLGHVTSRPII